MQKLTKKYAIILFKSAMLTSVIYGFVVYQTLDKLVKNEIAQFHLVTKSIQDYKSTLYLLSVLLEAEIELNAGNDVDEPLLDQGRVYRLIPDAALTQNEKIVSSTAQRLFLSMPELAVGLEYLLYYRSYEGLKILASQSFSLAGEEIDEVFSEKMCAESFRCARYASAQDLSNRIVVSDVYRDRITRQAIITISSPVYDGLVMVGDLNIDIYLNEFPFLDNKTYVSNNSSNGREMIVEDLRYPFHQSAYSERFVVDEDFAVIYRIPYSQIIVDTLWLYFLMVTALFYVVIRLEELKTKREKLKLAEIAIRRDEMTGLYNRAALRDSSLKYAIEKQGLAVIAIDGDKLKSINDTFGHHVGDEAIVFIARCMQACFRESDYLIRSGGDEFLVLLPGCDERTAQSLASRLASEVRAKSFGTQQLSLNISFGVAVVEEAETLESAIQRADSRLYQVKRSKV
ncbi:GGDEF domain-containing protein [Vibrio hangzhouensis]|uniref:diguanylate cyclase n=1 Tax=Vibrio hangzhouensis TaxID=462991 RepID=A0A1H5SYV7_9VIBR|nr:diguanylate cyclase [Vibrio hangzhouensis]SEF54967.1 diguanylate cyclase (GGDEF) domain-containing protein [Vibrio hangzhouensis]